MWKNVVISMIGTNKSCSNPYTLIYFKFAPSIWFQTEVAIDSLRCPT